MADRGPEALFCAAQAATVVLLGEVFWIDHWSFTRIAAVLTVPIPVALNTGATT